MVIGVHGSFIDKKMIVTALIGISTGMYLGNTIPQEVATPTLILYLALTLALFTKGVYSFLDTVDKLVWDITTKRRVRRNIELDKKNEI